MTAKELYVRTGMEKVLRVCLQRIIVTVVVVVMDVLRAIQCVLAQTLCLLEFSVGVKHVANLKKRNVRLQLQLLKEQEEGVLRRIAVINILTSLPSCECPQECMLVCT